MLIRLAEQQDFAQILKIYQAARLYMKTHGNPHQWGDHHPDPQTLESDLYERQLYVLEGNDTIAHAAFVLFTHAEPTYAHIDGSWLDDGPYGCIHRVASDGTMHGTFRLIADFCKTQASSLRIDTHADNRTMQHVVEQAGFVRCGIIRLPDGDPRIAYQYLPPCCASQQARR